MFWLLFETAFEVVKWSSLTNMSITNCHFGIILSSAFFYLLYIKSQQKFFCSVMYQLQAVSFQSFQQLCTSVYLCALHRPFPNLPDASSITFECPHYVDFFIQCHVHDHYHALLVCINYIQKLIYKP